MYRLTVHAVEIMDLYDITATLLEDQGPEGWQRIATTHDTVSLGPEDSQLDSFQRILCAIAQWSNRTIQ